MLLVSPISWDHYFVLLFLSLVLLWRELPAGGAGRRVFWVLVALVWLTPMAYWQPLIGATMSDWMTRTALPWQTATALSVQCYALLGVFAFGLATASGTSPTGLR